MEQVIRADREERKAERKTDETNLKEMMEGMMNANQAKTNSNLKEMRDEVNSGQAEMKSTVKAILSELGDVNHKMQDLHKVMTNKIERKNTGGITNSRGAPRRTDKEIPGRPSIYQIRLPQRLRFNPRYGTGNL
jgi:dsDNA-specific endonuclease/ATPase MutS2